MTQDTTEWDPEFRKYIEELNSRCKKVNTKDWVPSRLAERDSLKHPEELGIIKPGQKVLDMGSGNGSAALVWAYNGYHVTGIELHPELFAISEKAIKEAAHFIKNGSVQVFQGSYYPKEYIEQREKGKSRDQYSAGRNDLRDQGNQSI